MRISFMSCYREVGIQIKPVNSEKEEEKIKLFNMYKTESA